MGNVTTTAPLREGAARFEKPRQLTTAEKVMLCVLLTPVLGVIALMIGIS